MKAQAACFMALAWAVPAFATNAVIREGSVSATQNPSHRLIVGYTLDNGPAIVTFDVRTNGVSIGAAPLANAQGDVNRLTEPGSREFTWKATKGWPGHYFPANGDVRVSVHVIAWDPACAPEVMVVNLRAPSDVMYYTSLDGVPGGIQDPVYKTDKLVLRKIPAEYVTWKMGSPESEPGYNRYDDVQHPVKLTKDYYLGVYEVTQRQWQNVMGSRPSHFNGDGCWETRPVESVGYSIEDSGHAADVRGNSDWPTGNDPHAVHGLSFFGRLRKLTGLAGLDLPTDAQWEYACRAGSGGPYYGDLEYGAESLGLLARFRDNGSVDGETVPGNACAADRGTASVGSYRPNAWGLYDMLGNVGEMCLDQFTQYGADAVVDPVGSSEADSQYHVFRGGSWRESLLSTRCGSRTIWSDSFGYQVDARVRIWERENYIGFRVCLHLK